MSVKFKKTKSKSKNLLSVTVKEKSNMKKRLFSPIHTQIIFQQEQTMA